MSRPIDMEWEESSDFSWSSFEDDVDDSNKPSNSKWKASSEGDSAGRTPSNDASTDKHKNVPENERECSPEPVDAPSGSLQGSLLDKYKELVADDEPVSSGDESSSHSGVASDAGDALELTPEEREQLLQKSTALKEQGGAEFTAGKINEALGHYQKALKLCPTSERVLRSVLHCNIAACYFSESNWSEVVAHASEALKIDSEYVKALWRRAYANERIGKWSNLEESQKDLLKMLQLIEKDDKFRPKAETLLRKVQAAISPARDAEVSEMTEKLKGMGNSLLGKLGLSLDNFNFQKDPSTGSYTMNMKN